MRLTLSLGILASLAIALPASARDFTGAYAGVNAGYGFERGRDAGKTGGVANRGSAVAPSNDLPPSAAVAAKSLQRATPVRPR